MGDNGAGKSKIMAGNFLPSGGEIRLDGEHVHFHKPAEARQKGIEASTRTLPCAATSRRRRTYFPSDSPTSVPRASPRKSATRAQALAARSLG